MILSVGLLTSVGCAHRLTLTPSEYERIETRERATDDLRVYVGRKLVVRYALADDAATYTVDKTIKTSSEQNLLRVIIAKNTKGLIIATEDRNGAPLLWVTFDSRCSEPACAWGFVETEDGVFRLHSVPEREGYNPPTAYYKRESKPMALARRESLAERNEVYVWTNRRGKLRTVDLTVKKRTATKRDVVTERGTGVD